MKLYRIKPSLGHQTDSIAVAAVHLLKDEILRGKLHLCDRLRLSRRTSFSPQVPTYVEAKRNQRLYNSVFDLRSNHKIQIC